MRRNPSAPWLGYVVALIFISVYSSRGDSLDLCSSWKLFSSTRQLANQVQLPSYVHPILVKNRWIPDPLVGKNERLGAAWSDTVYSFRKEFTLSESEHLRYRFLKLEGIDTWARIFLNGRWIGETQNAFRTYRILISDALKVGQNRLEIQLLPARRLADSLAKAALPMVLPDNARVYVRKPGFHFGWDWAPALYPAGITGKVLLEEGIPEVEHFSLLNEGRNTEKAWLRVRLKSEVPGKSYTLLLRSPEGKTDSFLVRDLSRIEVSNPSLWWPNGYGKQPLYDARLIDKGKELARSRIGIRTVEWNLDTPFLLKINGRPIFCRGANWVPKQVFQTQNDSSGYRDLIQKLAAVNGNMLRVWGGGQREEELFYSLCDEMGILVWQDFPFACAMYPWDSRFLEEVRAESTELIQRLRGHCSLVLWCGNNEVDEAWHQWGWKKDSGGDSTRIWEGYRYVFHRTIPEILLQEDPSRIYHSSSPTYGWGNANSYIRGDSHYWGVWWAYQDASIFRTKTGLFVSEFGMQGFPSEEVLKEFGSLSDSSSYRAHQKHPRGYETLSTYLKRNGKNWQTWPQFIRLVNAYQADALDTIITWHRAYAGHCNGSLLWQWNDCWPVVSWSIIDVKGHPKPAYLRLKTLWAPEKASILIDSTGQRKLSLSWDNAAEDTLFFQSGKRVEREILKLSEYGSTFLSLPNWAKEVTWIHGPRRLKIRTEID